MQVLELKKQLYKSLILPLLDYPCVQNYYSGRKNISRLQKIQNKALRFIEGIALSSKRTSQSLHEKHKLNPINLRLKKLAFSTLSKLVNLYNSINSSDIYPVEYKFSNFSISREPHFMKSKSNFTKLIDTLWRHSEAPLYDIPDELEQWGNNIPVYL